MKTTDPPIVVSHTFTNPVHEVWDALTQHNQMTQWFFDNIPDFKAKEGFKTQFNVEAPSRDFMHLWEVTQVIPLQLLVCNWKYEGLPGSSYVSYELTQNSEGTTLTVSTKVVEDFDDAIPEFKPESCQAGWNYFIKERLVAFLSTKN